MNQMKAQSAVTTPALFLEDGMQMVTELQISALVLEFLLDNDLPAEWEDAVTEEFEAALTDRKAEILSTFAEGRPFDMPITEWIADFQEAE